ncbi:MAG: methyltransferase [Rhodospirillales bacterium]|nr:methyltransferase [Rhodospirillales bacterium]
MSAAPPSYSEDRLLGGRIALRQPTTGYRVAIDPVFLAAAVPAEGTEHVLDMGCGVGAAALCLAMRVPGCRVTGIEFQRDLVHLAGDNIELNGLSLRLSVMLGDLVHLPPRLSPGAFDHVMANPPYLEAGAASAPPDASKAAANLEGAADLATWVRVALAMVRPKGTVTFVHRADRLEDLLAPLAGRAGGIVVYPLWAGAGKPARRVVVRARKHIATPTILSPGMMLHDAAGRFTPEAEAILRDAAPLVL